MNIGLVDVDNLYRKKITFPNLPLMKISAWHKKKGDHVEWYEHGISPHMDIVYLAKVFGNEYTQEYMWQPDADKIIRGGSGWAIKIKDGQERYEKDKDKALPDEIEHIMPDYGLYGITNTAYGFLTRGCPRGCAFCHVAGMQGRHTRTVARLSEFWEGQKNVVLLDPNITASGDYFMHMKDLQESGAWVDFSQGLDARLLTREKIEALNGVKYKMIHFAWDKPEENLKPHFMRIKEHLTRCDHRKVSAYVLTNFGSTHEQDMERIMFLRELDIQPYVMIYRKETAPKVTRHLQRWCNPFIFWKVPTFDEYLATRRRK